MLGIHAINCHSVAKVQKSMHIVIFETDIHKWLIMKTKLDLQRLNVWKVTWQRLLCIWFNLFHLIKFLQWRMINSCHSLISLYNVHITYSYTFILFHKCFFISMNYGLLSYLSSQRKESLTSFTHIILIAWKEVTDVNSTFDKYYD